MITDHYLKCGDCPHLMIEHWRGGRTAVRCASPESPYAPLRRVIAVLPDFTKDPGNGAIRQRWCHLIAEGKDPSPACGLGSG